MKKILSILIGLLFIFAANPVLAGGKKSKSPHSIKFSAQSGAGYDSNVFNKKTPQEGALLEQSSASVKYKFKASKRVSWNNSLKLGNSYRSGDASIEALKINLNGKTGIKWKAFGKKNKPQGFLSFNVGYSGAFTPTLNNPTEDEDFIEDEDETEDNLGDDFFDEGADEELATDDGGDDFDADESEGDAEDGDDDEDFDDAEDLGTKVFNSKPNRHMITADAGMAIVFNKTTSLGYTMKGTLGEIDETPGRTSSDFWQLNNGLNVQKKLFKKKVVLKGGYNFGVKFFSEKVAPSGDSLKIYSHAASFGAAIKPLKKFKINTGYRLGYSQIPTNSTANTIFHQGLFGLEYKIMKQLSVFETNHFTYSGKTLAAIYAPRFQMMLGLKTKF